MAIYLAESLCSAYSGARLRGFSVIAPAHSALTSPESGSLIFDIPFPSIQFSRPIGFWRS